MHSSISAMLWNIGSSGALIDCWSVRRAWQLDCKRFITNRGDIISALMMSPRLVMKRLQSNCQARRTDQQSFQYIFEVVSRHMLALLSFCCKDGRCRSTLFWSPPQHLRTRPSMSEKVDNLMKIEYVHCKNCATGYFVDKLHTQTYNERKEDLDEMRFVSLLRELAEKFRAKCYLYPPKVFNYISPSGSAYFTGNGWVIQYSDSVYPADKRPNGHLAHNEATVGSTEKCSVFLFEKYIADKLHKPRRSEIVTHMLKREIKLLMQLKHPNLLHVIWPAEETSDSLAFATEQVSASLANLLGNHTRMPQPIPPEIQNFQFDDMVRKLCLYQLTSTLRFLHSGQALFHNNVSPGSILLTAQSQWRLAGLAFVEIIKDDKCEKGRAAENESFIEGYRSGKSTKRNTSVSESRTATSGEIPGPWSDMFSLGLLICSLYSVGEPSPHSLCCVAQDRETPLSSRDTKEHKNQPSGECTNAESVSQKDRNPDIIRARQLAVDMQIPELFRKTVGRMPLELVEPVEKMLSRSSQRRPTSQLFALGSSCKGIRIKRKILDSMNRRFSVAKIRQHEYDYFIAVRRRRLVMRAPENPIRILAIKINTGVMAKIHLVLKTLNDTTFCAYIDANTPQIMDTVKPVMDFMCKRPQKTYENAI
ncbi:SCY1-like protein 2, partial [Clonorchis sinensis]